MPTTKTYTAEYDKSCRMAARLFDKGQTLAKIAEHLRSNAYLTATGLTRWYATNTRRAVERGRILNNKPTPPTPKTSKKPAKTEKSGKANKPEFLRKAIEATKGEAVASLPLAREPRRGLKRMISRSEWQTMPAEVRKAVVAELADRLLAVSDK
jgi:hypothetical protein